MNSKVIEITMNIVNVGYDSTNYYVLEVRNPAIKNQDKNVRLLVDVGMPGTLPMLLANLKRKDLSLASIGYLLCTHYHPDHAGIAQNVKAQGVRLIVMEPQVAAVPLLNSYVKPTDPFTSIELYNTIQLATSASRAFLKNLGIHGEIISTPGHSDDSVSLVLDDGLAFTGDLHRPAVADDANRAKTVRSWEQLSALRVTSIYPGHGPQQPIGPT
jgi:glyoxylase-like metal-dependent hydrolase (beta-lactamase superfamily II)